MTDNCLLIYNSSFKTSNNVHGIFENANEVYLNVFGYEKYALNMLAHSLLTILKWLFSYLIFQKYNYCKYVNTSLHLCKYITIIVSGLNFL